tara:strand:- start:33 stop:431 length:399 start_codon:yes stop_codon:yes gene_type:complete
MSATKSVCAKDKEAGCISEQDGKVMSTRDKADTHLDESASQDLMEIVENYKNVKHMGSTMQNNKRISTRVPKTIALKDRYCDKDFQTMMLDGHSVESVREEFEMDAAQESEIPQAKDDDEDYVYESDEYDDY